MPFSWRLSFFCTGGHFFKRGCNLNCEFLLTIYFLFILSETIFMLSDRIKFMGIKMLDP